MTRLWNTNFVLLLASGHIFFFTFYALIVAVPKYLNGYSDTVIGIVVGVFGLGSFATRLWAGAATDAYGRKRMLLIGCSGVALMLLLYAQGAFPLGLVPVRLFHGMLWVVVMTSWTTLALDLAPAGRRGEAMGATLTSTHSASLYAPAVSVLIGSQFGYQVLFVVLAMLGVLALALAWKVPEPVFERRPLGSRRRIPISRPALPALFAFMGTTVAFGAIQGFLVLRAEGHASTQFFFLPFGVMVILASLTAGRIGARVGLSVITFFGLTMVASSMLLLAAMAEAPALAIAGVLFATGFGAGYTSTSTMAGEAVSAEERGLAIATVTMAFDLGTAAPFVLGALSDTAGVSSVFLFAAALAIVSLVYFGGYERGRHGQRAVIAVPSGDG